MIPISGTSALTDWQGILNSTSTMNTNNVNGYWNETPSTTGLNPMGSAPLVNFSPNASGINSFQAASYAPLSNNNTMTLGEIAKQFKTGTESESEIEAEEPSNTVKNTTTTATRNSLSTPMSMVNRIIKGDIVSNEEIFSSVDDGLFKDAGLNESTQAEIKGERSKKTGRDEQFGNTPYASVNMKKKGYMEIARYDLPYALKLQEEDVQRAIKDEETQMEKIEAAATKEAVATPSSTEVPTIVTELPTVAVATTEPAVATPAPAVATPAPTATTPAPEPKKQERDLDLENSQEDRKTAVEAAYQKILGRSVDPAGLKTYTTQLQRGWSIARLEQDLRRSDEYKDKKK